MPSSSVMNRLGGERLRRAHSRAKRGERSEHLSFANEDLRCSLRSRLLRRQSGLDRVSPHQKVQGAGEGIVLTDRVESIAEAPGGALISSHPSCEDRRSNSNGPLVHLRNPLIVMKRTNRRQFIRHGAVLAGAVTIAPSLRAAEASRRITLGL